jgi:hypothetical protein
MNKMTDEEIESWAKAYIDAQQGDAIDADHPLWWAVDNFWEGGDRVTSTEDRWNAILKILSLNPPQSVISMLAAGPLEDLIADHGAEFIDRVELEARRSPTFGYLLGGVWPRGGSKEIFSRLEKSAWKNGVVAGATESAAAAVFEVGLEVSGGELRTVTVGK